jgi:hypothetical protein
MPEDRLQSLRRVAELLVRVRDAGSTAQADELVRDLHGLHPDAQDVLANVFHYTADFDIRARDEEYRKVQEHELEGLIDALRRGAARDELLDFTLLP